jgi:hypothetical protein
MAGIEDYSTTPGSNTTINGISLAEGMPPSNVNDVMRQQMADIRREYTVTSLTSSVTISIGEAVGGKIHIITDAGKSISAFDSISAGIERDLVFDVGGILIHDGTKMILPGAANLTISAGDSVRFLSEGSGNWRLLSYIKASSPFATHAGAETLTNKTINASNNTITNIGQTEIAAAAIGQGELKTTTAAADTTQLTNPGAFSVTLTGGTYSLWTLSSTAASPDHVSFGNGDTAAGVIGLQLMGGGGSATVSRDERYVQASPPYNLGHGDIPLFVFVLMEGGNVVGIEVAPDPTWAYHGPTNICPERRDRVTGKGYRRYREIGGVPYVAAIKDPLMLRRVMAGAQEVTMIEREITHEIKNRDMNLWPHPWCVGNDLTGKSVVLLDPTSALVDRLANIHAEAEAREVVGIVKQYLTIDNAPLSYTTPTGVVARRVTMR